MTSPIAQAILKDGLRKWNAGRQLLVTIFGACSKAAHYATGFLSAA